LLYITQQLRHFHHDVGGHSNICVQHRTRYPACQSGWTSSETIRSIIPKSRTMKSIFFSLPSVTAEWMLPCNSAAKVLIMRRKGRPMENIKSFGYDEVRKRLTALGLPSYRADQVRRWIYQQQVRSFDEMSNISKHERALLSSLFEISALRILAEESSADGTSKLLFGLEDLHTVESVLIPDENRLTLCISSQVGCRQACRFCLTGGRGFVRNLHAWEIADQVLEASYRLRTRSAFPITNIVLMGMGEPLDNITEVIASLRLITDDTGLGISPRRITVSTSGLVPGMDRLAASGLKVNLAVSLNASTDDVRDRIMPVNRSYPLRELLAACRRFPLDNRRRITFEYVLLGGVNDAPDDAERVARLLKGIRCKVNLIPFNPFPGSSFKRPSKDSVRRFQQILLGHHYTAPVRESRGRDISAACGQLRERRDVSRAAPGLAK
jgi:23S rRNA (adenine2503-C2)-methyltransferase